MCMVNEIFEINYTKCIEPVYGEKRNVYEDNKITKNISEKHEYSIDIDERISMIEHEVYSIDPDGCEDADDAFSIYIDNSKLYLAIHIADPTEYIQLNSDLWNNIVKRTTTKYPSNRKPIHMIPDDIMRLSSLKGINEIKNAITVLTEIDKDSYIPIGEVKLLFSKVLVKLENSYSYKEASEKKEMEVLKTGLKISKGLQEIRAKNTKGVKLNELSLAYTRFNNDEIYLYQDTEEEKEMRQMISEFAIFANSFVGEYLKNTLNTGIFRTCDAQDWLKNTSDTITGEEMIQQIITNGITADYLSNIKSHDLVGMPEYCHFTSPIRRLADCVCHYLLKYVYFNNKNLISNIPFTDYELQILSNRCLSATKQDKKNQYLDIKFRLLQVMDAIIRENNSLILEYYITSYSGLFLNIIICKINDYNVHMSYTLRTRNYCIKRNASEHKKIVCTKVNCFTKYDQGCIPELDKIFLF